MALSYLTGSVTQGAADAFAVAEIPTALSGITNVAYRVREILFQQPILAAINNVVLEACVTRRTKAAFPLVTDRDVLAMVQQRFSFTTSGAWFQDRVLRFAYQESDELLVVEDPLYLVIDSNATGAANQFNVRIGYERVSISALDRLSLLTQSLD